jgi:hypothetical protein
MAHHHPRTRRPRELADTALLASAWREVRGAARGITPASSGSTVRIALRASFASTCPRCEKSIRIGDEIRRDREFGGYIHTGCRTKPAPTEKGRPNTGVTVRRTTDPTVCPECRLQHAGECW